MALPAHQLYAGIAPWCALCLLLSGRNPFPSRRRLLGSLLLASLLLLVPLPGIGGGWSLIHGVFLLEANPSITLTALLVVALAQRLGGRKFFRPSDWNAAWIFGAAASLVLYPMALGLTRTDPYALGWGPELPAAAAVIALVLILGGNRFGVLLLLPPAGFLLRIQESCNFWDALLDPFYGGVSLIAAGRLLFSRLRRS
jgi:hypothetical protein